MMVDKKAEQNVGINYDELAREAWRDQSALGMLYEKTYDRIFQFCVHRLYCRATAQDVTSNVFLAVARNIRQFKGKNERDFCNWLYSIAANHTTQYLRKQYRQRNLLQNKADCLLSERGESAHRDRHPDWSDVYQAIIQLKPATQTIITLRFFEGLSHEQIAEILGKKPSAVRVALHRGLQRLKQKLNAVSVEGFGHE